jgi:cell division protein FtsB
MQNERKSKVKIYATRLVFLAGLVGLVFIGWSIFQEISKKKSIQDEINSLQAEAERVKHDNILSQEKISYLESSNYQEKEAKDKLNLQNKDEKVVIIKPSVTKEAENSDKITDNPKSVPQPDASPNYVKWWQYFFGTKANQ